MQVPTILNGAELQLWKAHLLFFLVFLIVALVVVVVVVVVLDFASDSTDCCGVIGGVSLSLIHI